jgi:CubicO group peptidase (beta-lactamase class C family)
MSYFDQGLFGAQGLMSPVEALLKDSQTPFVRPDKVTAPLDPRIGQVQVWHCLAHCADWNGNGLAEQYSNIQDAMAVANALFPGTNWKTTYPVTKAETIAYASGLQAAILPLQQAPCGPGSLFQYNGFGYFVLGCVVWALRKQDYHNAFRYDDKGICKLLGLQRPQVTDALDALTGEEVRYHASAPACS